MNITKQERDKLRELAEKSDLTEFAEAVNQDTILALLGMIDRPAASGDVRGFDAWARSEGLIQESHGIMAVSSMCNVARKAWQAASAQRAPVSQFSEDDLTQEFDLDTIIKGLCYDDDKKFNAWEDELNEYIRVECNKAVSAANGEQK